MHARLRTRLLAATVILPALFGPAAAQDASELIVRLGRLESQSRTMAGQIETLQYENRQLKEQLRKFQEDVDFRFNEQKGAKPSRGAAPAPSAAPAPVPSAPGSVNGGNPGFNPGPAKSQQQQKRGDAFDPAANPDAPGAPMRLGTTEPSVPLPPREAVEAAEAQPPRLPRGAIDDDAEEGGYDEPVDLNPPPAHRRDPVRAAAERERRLDRHPRCGRGLRFRRGAGPLAPVRAGGDEPAPVPAIPPPRHAGGRATYWLGESYLARGRTREAAEQFLKVSTDYARSPQAPEAMLKLSVTLNALGAKEQACATLAELERKFPNAGTGVRQGVTREQKRARCSA